MKIFFIIFGAIIAAVIFIVVGCSALLNESIEDVENESKAAGITKAEFQSVKIGTPLAEVIDSLGKPDDRQRDNVQGLGQSTCIYYPSTKEFLDRYQFCFNGKNKLRSKASY